MSLEAVISWIILLATLQFILTSAHEHLSFPDKAITGAVIVSSNAHHHQSPYPEIHGHEKHDWSRTQQAREENVKNLVSQMPFRVDEWPAIFTGACPSMRQWHSERGLMYAHYQIFFDFVHIDHEVMENSLRDPKGYYNSSDPHEIKTNRYFYEYYNGSYYRDGQLLSENDILVVFEDDAIVIKRNISFLLRREFENFNKELVRLGWCQSDEEPLCTHAYAVTRAGVRKFVKYYDPCGVSIDWLMIDMARKERITWRINMLAPDELYIDEYKNTDNFNSFFAQAKLGSLSRFRDIDNVIRR